MKNTKNNLRRAQSLTTTLAIAFFGLSALALLIFSSLQILLTIPTQQAAISNQEQLIALGAAKTVGSFIDEKFAVLSTTMGLANPETLSPAAQTQILTSLLAREPALNQLVIFDAQNNKSATASRIFVNASASSAKFISRVTSDILVQAQKGKTYISDVYYDQVTGAPSVIIGVPAFDTLGSFHGTLFAELNLISIWSLINELKVGDTGYVYLVDKKGTLIAFRDTTRVIEGANESSFKVVDEFMKNPATFSGTEVSTYTGIKGTRVVGTYSAVGTPDWAVIIELPWTEAYQDIIRIIEISIAIILVIAVLAGLTGVYAARRLAMPLVKLTETASRIAVGETRLQAEIGGTQEVASLATAFNSMTSQLRDLIGTLEERVTTRTVELQTANETNSRRARQFEAISQVSRAINQTKNLQDLLPQITEVINQQFNFYHVGIFLLDANNEYAVLAAANSEGGKKMLARDHKLKVGQVGIVGNVAGTGIPRIALDTGADAIYFNNPDLPETRSEMALPLFRTGQQLIGVIDVQSTQPIAFGQDDIQILITLADQVSIAISNARLYEETQKALLESETLYRRDIQSGWIKFARAQRLSGVRRHGEKTNLLTEPLNLPGAMEVTRSGNIYQTKAEGNDKSVQMTIPMKLRGEVVGLLNVKTESGREWSSDEIDIVTAIIERAALSIDSARLLQEAQKRASKERAIGEISAKIGGLVNIENIVQTAIRELGVTMPNTDIAIQFKKTQETE